MRWSRRAVAGAAVLAVVGLVAGSCSDSGGTDPVENAEIMVTVEADGSSLSGVAVSLYAEGGSTALDQATTNSSGEARFADVDPGAYEVEIDVPSGYALSDGEARRSVTVGDGQTGSVSYMLTEESSDVVEVRLTSSLAFSPAEVTIEPGTTVRWVNDADIYHTITPDGHSEWSRQEMNDAGETFDHTFNTEGEFPYYCEPHQPGMAGTITVESP